MAAGEIHQQTFLCLLPLLLSLCFINTLSNRKRNVVAANVSKKVGRTIIRGVFAIGPCGSGALPVGWGRSSAVCPAGGAEDVAVVDDLQ